MKESGLRGRALKGAKESVENAKQPIQKAKRIVGNRVGRIPNEPSVFDQLVSVSDVHELYIRALRKIGCFYPSDGIARYFEKLFREAATSKLTSSRFKKISKSLFKIFKFSRDEIDSRKKEVKFQRGQLSIGKNTSPKNLRGIEAIVDSEIGFEPTHETCQPALTESVPLPATEPVETKNHIDRGSQKTTAKFVRTCQYIKGDYKGAPKCGKEAQRHSSYCPKHHKICYVTSKK